MAILRKKKNDKIEEIKKVEEIKTELEESTIRTNELKKENLISDDKTVDNKTEETTEVKTEEVKEEKASKKISLKKGTKVVANGRCFGASSLECPLKSVRNYETKILDVDKENNSVLIDNGWISIDNLIK